MFILCVLLKLNVLANESNQINFNVQHIQTMPQNQSAARMTMGFPRTPQILHQHVQPGSDNFRSPYINQGYTVHFQNVSNAPQQVNMNNVDKASYIPQQVSI